MMRIVGGYSEEGREDCSNWRVDWDGWSLVCGERSIDPASITKTPKIRHRRSDQVLFLRRHLSPLSMISANLVLNYGTCFGIYRRETCENF